MGAVNNRDGISRSTATRAAATGTFIAAGSEPPGTTVIAEQFEHVVDPEACIVSS